jgi:hypothetical protein
MGGYVHLLREMFDQFKRRLKTLFFIAESAKLHRGRGEKFLSLSKLKEELCDLCVSLLSLRLTALDTNTLIWAISFDKWCHFWGSSLLCPYHPAFYGCFY